MLIPPAKCVFVSVAITSVLVLVQMLIGSKIQSNWQLLYVADDRVPKAIVVIAEAENLKGSFATIASARDYGHWRGDIVLLTSEDTIKNPIYTDLVRVLNNLPSVSIQTARPHPYIKNSEKGLEYPLTHLFCDPKFRQFKQVLYVQTSTLIVSEIASIFDAPVKNGVALNRTNGLINLMLIDYSSLASTREFDDLFRSFIRRHKDKNEDAFIRNTFKTHDELAVNDLSAVANFKLDSHRAWELLNNNNKNTIISSPYSNVPFKNTSTLFPIYQSLVTRHCGPDKTCRNALR
jgi:hypothetical protein